MQGSEPSEYENTGDSREHLRTFRRSDIIDQHARRVQRAGTVMHRSGTALKDSGRGVEIAGKGAKYTGKGLNAAGKGVGAGSQALMRAGAATSEFGVGIPLVAAGAVGKAVGLGMQGAGKGVEAGGRAAEASGKAMKKAGAATEKAGKQAQGISHRFGKVGGALKKTKFSTLPSFGGSSLSLPVKMSIFSFFCWVLGALLGLIGMSLVAEVLLWGTWIFVMVLKYLKYVTHPTILVSAAIGFIWGSTPFLNYIPLDVVATIFTFFFISKLQKAHALAQAEAAAEEEYHEQKQQMAIEHFQRQQEEDDLEDEEDDEQSNMQISQGRSIPSQPQKQLSFRNYNSSPQYTGSRSQSSRPQGRPQMQSFRGVGNKRAA